MENGKPEDKAHLESDMVRSTRDMLQSRVSMEAVCSTGNKQLAASYVDLSVLTEVVELPCCLWAWLDMSERTLVRSVSYPLSEAEVVEEGRHMRWIAQAVNVG